MTITKKSLPVLMAGIFGALAFFGIVAAIVLAVVGGFADIPTNLGIWCSVLFVGCCTGGFFAYRDYRGLDSGTLESELPVLKSDKQRRRFFRSVVRHSLKMPEVPKDILSALERKRTQIGLDSSDATAIVGACAEEALSRKLAAFAIGNAEISDRDEEALRSFAQTIGGEFSIPDSVREQYQHGRSLWRSRHASLSAIDTGLNLPPDEICYFESPCEWYEIRRERIRIDRGKYVSRDAWKALSVGMVYFTNKRVIFQGDNAFNKTLPARKILEFHAQKEGIYLSKETGKAPLLKIKDADIATAIIGRIIRGEIDIKE